MSIDVLRRVSPAEARGMSKSLLTTVDAASTPPADPPPLARYGAMAMPELIAQAHRATAELLASAARRDVARKERERMVDEAMLAEKRVDRRVGGLSADLASKVQFETEGGEALQAFLLPDGSMAFTENAGRPARGAYDEWVVTFPKRPAQGSAADEELAPKLAEIVALVGVFGATLDAKDVVSRAADEAIGALGAARERWAVAIADLREGVQVVNKAAPARAEVWWTPVLEWQRAQEARAARGEPELDPDLPPEAGDADLDEASTTP
jgi:hypothetical protein